MYFAINTDSEKNTQQKLQFYKQAALLIEKKIHNTIINLRTDQTSEDEEEKAPVHDSNVWS